MQFFKILSLALALSIFGCKRPAAKQSNAVVVTGTVFETQSYCGGAAPSEDRLAQMKIPKPLAGKVIYIKSGKANDPEAPVVAEVTADERGEFSVNLEPGFYVMVDEKRVDKASYNYMMSNFAEKTENYTAVDKACLDKWVAEANLVFEVSAEANEPLSVTFHKPCSWNSFPCVTFIGERPR
ncbi:hypothetical protein [Imperialibacter roseus]|uniref:Carboxypeptidase regulatory-like domain-containing protein n=1 Tax=Imperialibacter roseus TaxID=1324217 RepID=A0ABZ0IPD9_9BACT|nr:hypothetical protein [Imperialibacter roseus]WOK06903.1 hypothetical protein RT717_27930 [Imperialibacter roseus]|tara:strand:- start:2032 stop:2577 length:546 start_codon:yes stop_codon:yes gene_type:complete